MEDRDLIIHREEGRRFIYEPVVSAEDVTRSMADEMVDDSSPAAWLAP